MRISVAPGVWTTDDPARGRMPHPTLGCERGPIDVPRSTEPSSLDAIRMKARRARAKANEVTV